MDYEDLFKIKPVLDFDVLGGKTLLIIRDKKPIVYSPFGVIDIKGYAEEVSWIGNDSFFITIDPNGSELRQIFIWDKGKLERIISDQYDNFSPLYTKNGILFLSNRDGKTIHLYLYDKEIKKLSKGDLPVFSYCANDKYIVYSQGIYDNDIHVIDYEGNEIAEIDFPESEQELPSDQCFLDEKTFLFISNHEDLFKLFAYDIKEEKIEKIRESKYEIVEAVPYKGSIAYVEDRHGDFALVHEKEILNEGFIVGLKSDEESLYFIYSNHESSYNLYKYDGKLSRLTNSMNGVKGEFVKPSHVEYNSDGIKIHALLYSKGNEDKGVIYIHGGPDWECVNSFNPEIQFLVNKGFKVICPNYRGSIGYGRKFNHLNDKDLGGGDLRDVINAIKVLNVKKVAITGASYGGYLTMMAVTKYPDLWCSAVAVVPFVNWFTEKKFEREYLQQYDEMKMGNDEVLLKDRSPIFFIDRIKTPLMLLAGENDPRCPAEETLQVVNELKKLGREVKYKIYKDEGHGFAKVENYIDSIKETVEFISTHCQ
ncbi:S9 family peptidase [Sulfurisphaera javensis]|uniref:S9 family peptidase n=1 Tax=Sulfurisphaera javensis TaxID=2049879 RepID=A0AAT9GN88_9CREN